MPSPATLAALQRLLAILLTLIEALAAPVEGAPRPLPTRLATRAFAAYLKHLAARLSVAAASEAVADPAPTTQPPRTHPHPTRTDHRPPTPHITRGDARDADHLPPPSPPTPYVKKARPAPPPSHVHFITLS